ncbi:DUF1697 domain-containing protein [Flavobacterium wongokense]|uniref:DUF1697 domain-containing protein n=1 Tax=Flavobacterium wongokense TaxID=2910674 RepID=UPI001F15F4E7|nr:DUF1697 domain-containing protein [Flavobacterium sp. WG47]MCF6132002.1 DUF1697 domain-containing protein [Flavobacterium sp. WG47]
MKTHLALLRGINVSGHKMIKMDLLKKALEAIGFNNVRTYINSGNVFVDSNEDSAKVGFMIKQEIFKVFGHDVPTFMVSEADLKFALENNPFYKEGKETKQLYVCFLTEKPTPNSIQELKDQDFKGDVFEVKESFLFLKYADSAANTKLDNKIIEKKLKVSSTTRNWNTTNKLYQMFRE